MKLNINMSTVNKKEIDSEKLYDVIIIGSGPAGMSSAIYSARKGLSVLVIAQKLGGQVNDTASVENYIGFEFITGEELASSFEKHMKSLKVDVLTDELVKSINKVNGNVFQIGVLKKLFKGQEIEKPIYSFTDYTRKKETEKVLPRDIIILEGILVLEEEKIRKLLDIKIYVDADEDERFIRRLVRDTKERGRSMESVIEQYLNVVKPMFLQFVEPSKRYADIVIPQGGLNDVAIDIIVSKIKSRT